MVKFLLDENLSEESAKFLESLGYDAKTVAHYGLSGARDDEIIREANRRRRILITLDLDFGELYYFSRRLRTGIVILRLPFQTVEAVNQAFTRLLESGIYEEEHNRPALVIVEDRRIRIRRLAR